MAEVRIALYRMNDNPNTCGKFMGNIKTTFVARVRGVFRGPFNVIAPTLELIRGISDSTDSSYEYDWYTEVNNFNYACIENAATVNPTVATKPAPSSAQECPRYYFVQNVTVDPMGRIIVSLLEDVLETYKTSIKNLTCFIERSENHYNKRIPDGFATALPGYKQTKYNLTYDAASSSWRSCEHMWGDSDGEDSHLNYIITIAGARASSTTSPSWPFAKYVPNNYPQLKIICTKAYLNKFINKLSSAVEQVLDDYFKTKENIISIECIPDGDLATDGSKYPCLKNGGTTSSDDSVFAATIDMPGFHNWAISKDENGWPYGFVLSKERAITTREWHVDLPNSTDWEYSGAYNTYSLKFNPFGTFDIPADEVLATSNGRVYFKINHSIITGQAQLLYTTGDKTQGAWKVLGETNLNYQIPYIAKQDVGSLFQNALRTSLSIGIGKMFNENAATSLEEANKASAEQITYSVSAYTTRGEAVTGSLGGKAFGVGTDDSGASATGEFGRPRSAYAAATKVSRADGSSSTTIAAKPITETWSTTRQPAVDPSIHTANAVKTGNAISILNSALTPLPAPSINGTLRGVMIDGLSSDTATQPPYIIRYYRDIILPPANIVGWPEMGTRQVNAYAGYTKCGWLSLDGFRSTSSSNTEPIPNGDELGMITNILTSGFYNKKGS